MLIPAPPTIPACVLGSWDNGRGTRLAPGSDPPLLRRTSRTYQVVLGEYERGVEEGPEQVIPINTGDLFVHPKWNANCVSCG